MLSLVPPRAGLALLLVLAACGDSGRATAGVSDTLGTSATSTPGPTSSGGPATTDTVSGGGSGSAASSALTGEPATGTLGETTAPDGTTTPGDTTSATTGTTGGTTGSSGCDVADVPDTLAFTYSKSIDLAPLDTIQASFYNQDAQEIVFFSYFGQGRRYSLIQAERAPRRPAELEHEIGRNDAFPDAAADAVGAEIPAAHAAASCGAGRRVIIASSVAMRSRSWRRSQIWSIAP